MQSPWQLLGISADQATEKDAKLAYARLIKVHRPDTDPAGFQQVREAYELAIAMIKQRVAHSEVVASNPPPPQPAIQQVAAPVVHAATAPQPVTVPVAQAKAEPPVQAPAPEPLPQEHEIPRALVEAEAAVQRARAAGYAPGIAKAVGSLFYACASVAEGSAAIQLWHEMLQRCTDGRPDIIAPGITIPQLITELEAGTSLVTHTCIGHWETTSDLASLERLGDAMLTESTRLHEGEAAIAALRIALEVGFSRPTTASRLMNYAFPHLEHDARERIVPQVEWQLQAGMNFHDFRDDQRTFWHQRFRRPRADWKWHDPASDAAIEYLSNSHDRSWKGYELIKQIAPADWVLRLESALQHAGGHTPAHTANIDEEPRQLHSNDRAWVAWLAWAGRVALLAFVLAGLAYGGRRAMQYAKTHRITDAMQTLTTTSGKAQNIPAAQTSIAPAANLHEVSNSSSEGAQACIKRAEELRSSRTSVATWVHLLTNLCRQAEIESAGASRNFNPAAKEAELRQSIQSLFGSITPSESDSRVEQLVLEVLILDPSFPAVLKEEATIRQQKTQVLASFLASWQLASRGGDLQKDIVANAAKRFLQEKGHGLSIDPSERSTLEGLARPSTDITSKPR